MSKLRVIWVALGFILYLYPQTGKALTLDEALKRDANTENTVLDLTMTAERAGFFVIVDETGPMMYTKLPFEINHVRIDTAIEEMRKWNGFYTTELRNGVLRIEPREMNNRGQFLNKVIGRFEVSNLSVASVIDLINKEAKVDINLIPSPPVNSVKITIKSDNITIEQIFMQISRQCHLRSWSTGHIYGVEGQPLGDKIMLFM